MGEGASGGYKSLVHFSDFKRPRTLLFGAKGQVGWELRRVLQAFADVTYYDVDDLDLTNTKELREAIRAIEPEVIINAAAYTAVDRAEEERELCMELNADIPGVMAEEAERLGAWMVHYSTDYVYNGKGRGPWREFDEPDPVNFYGVSKLAGDCAILEKCSRYLIFRTSWVYSARGNNFLLTMMNLFRAGRSVRVINDQVGIPTSANFLAAATLLVLKEAWTSPTNLSGLYNLTPSGEPATWFTFADAIQWYAGISPKVEITPIPTEAYPTAARRPAYSVLSTERIRDKFSIHLPDWHICMEFCIDEILEREKQKGEKK